MNDEVKKETTYGLITGRGNGDWGRITVRTDGSLLLENVSLTVAGGREIWRQGRKASN